MNKDLTELVFILDRSGSMSGMESDTIGGFNSMLDKHRKASGDAVVTTVLFDNQYEVLHDRVPIDDVRDITHEYYARGSTAMLDAIGRTIVKIVNAQKGIAEEKRPGSTVFVIITDGMENASCEYNYRQIRNMLETSKQHGWQFLFLGANIDAVGTAERMGIDRDNAVDYVPDGIGTRKNFTAVADAVCRVREQRHAGFSASIDREWADDIRSDYKHRGRK